jgi:hypothetical protein
MEPKSSPEPNLASPTTKKIVGISMLINNLILTAIVYFPIFPNLTRRISSPIPEAPFIILAIIAVLAGIFLPLKLSGGNKSELSGLAPSSSTAPTDAKHTWVMSLLRLACFEIPTILGLVLAVLAGTTNLALTLCASGCMLTLGTLIKENAQS